MEIQLQIKPLTIRSSGLCDLMTSDFGNVTARCPWRDDETLFTVESNSENLICIFFFPLKKKKKKKHKPFQKRDQAVTLGETLSPSLPGCSLCMTCFHPANT